MIVAGVGHSILLDLEEAVKDACSMAMEQMGSTTVDFLLCFATTEFASHYPRLFKELETRAGTPNIVGCSAMAVLTGEREFEGSPGLAILAISSDELEIIPFLADDPSSAGGTIQELTKDRLSQGAAGNAFLLLLSDIFSIRAPELLDSLNRDMGYFPIVGAAASGHPEDKATVQWAASRHTKHGLAGALFSGPIQHRTRVSPGCEPIGEPFVITGAEGMVIKEIGNRPAYDTLQDALAIFPPEEMERVSKGILAGILFDEHKYPPKRGDYLARSIASVDPEAGTITIVENVRPGQTLQFQVRNPSTAREELETEVRGISWDSGLKTPLFAFYFESLGRGGRVHKEPDHDLKIIKEGLGEVPIIGFLSNAEFTPRNSRNLVHNYSAALTVVFRQGKKSAKKK